MLYARITFRTDNGYKAKYISAKSLTALGTYCDRYYKDREKELDVKFISNDGADFLSKTGKKFTLVH